MGNAVRLSAEQVVLLDEGQGPRIWKRLRSTQTARALRSTLRLRPGRSSGSSSGAISGGDGFPAQRAVKDFQPL